MPRHPGAYLSAHKLLQRRAVQPGLVIGAWLAPHQHTAKAVGGRCITTLFAVDTPMRLILILIFLVACLNAEDAISGDYCTVHFRDGRAITGYWDKVNGKLTMVNPKAILDVDPLDVVSTEAAELAKPPPAKAPVEQPDSEDAADITSFTINTFIDGGSELHIMQYGLKWIEVQDVSRPGFTDSDNIGVTYINDRGWIPIWSDRMTRGKGESSIYLGRFAAGDWTFQLISCSLVSNGDGILQRDPITIRRNGKESVLSIPDNQPGGRWYKIKLMIGVPPAPNAFAPSQTPKTLASPSPDPKPIPPAITSQDIRTFMLSIDPTGRTRTYSAEIRAKIFAFTRAWLATADLESIHSKRIHMHAVDAEHPDDFDEQEQYNTDARKLDWYLIELRKDRAALLADGATVDSTEASWKMVLVIFRNIFFMDTYFPLKGLE